MVGYRVWIAAGAVLVIVLASALAYAALDEGGPSSTKILQPSAAQLAAAGLAELPVAPTSKRVDLITPTFSNPTDVTNPLFPISKLRSAVLTGRVDGKPFKTETTLLPETRIIEWPNGRQVETLVSQYVAYLDGRIKEIALDHYAQADDGSVWYFGEEVFDYEDGVIASSEGTWLAANDGPAAMIMPGDPKVGDVYRSENIPGVAFEEVTVKTVDETVNGPHGPVEGAMIGEELHADGTREDKIFAPGYGEFFTGGGGDVEAMALAVPTDKLPGPPPAELETLSSGANDVFDLALARDWKAASATVRTMTGAWKTLQAGKVPPRLAPQMSHALDRLAQAVAARDSARAWHTAIGAAQAGLDLQLPYRPPAEIDRARFELWARQLVVDAAARDAGGVSGDLATVKLIRDRFAHTLDAVDVTRIDAYVLELETKLSDEDLPGAAAEATRLRHFLAKL